jgi:hypothetical protein
MEVSASTGPRAETSTATSTTPRTR